MSKPKASNVNKSIGTLLEMMDRDQLVLPEMQRDFIWQKKSIKLLVDSLFRGLPIGQMLVWKAVTAVETKAFDRKPLRRPRFDSFYGYLLDGQQRLTALRHLRDGDEDFPLMFYLWPDREADEEEALYWRRKSEQDNPWCIPVGEVLDEGFDLLPRLSAIKADSDFKPEHEEHVRRELASLNAIVDYDVGVTEFEADDYKLATELFIRFNSTGRKLRRGDLSMAELAIHVPGLAANEIRKAQSRWKAFRFTMPFLVQCLLAVHTGRFRLQDPKQFWAQVRQADVRASWRDTERAIGKLVEFLTGTVRWGSASLIPSFVALIPLVVVLARGDRWSGEDKRLARRWLLLASTHGYFSTSAETRLDRVLRNIESKPSIRKLWSNSKRSLRRLRAEDFRTSRLSGPVMSLYLSMIRERDARDWLSDSPLDGSVVGHGASLQVHHFFPKALLRKQTKMKHSDINTFANYTVISANANLDVTTEEPGAYLTRLGVSTRQLQKQCIPLERSLWRVPRYRDFLARRSKLLTEQANEFLGV